MKKLILLSVILIVGCDLFEPIDCTGIRGGTSIKDVCGVCDGDGTSCQSGCESLEGYWGCDDICNGLVEDECEVCGGDGPEENYDCDGNCINIDCAGECAKNIFLWGVCYNISETYGLYLSSSITLNQ